MSWLTYLLKVIRTSFRCRVLTKLIHWESAMFVIKGSYSSAVLMLAAWHVMSDNLIIICCTEKEMMKFGFSLSAVKSMIDCPTLCRYTWDHGSYWTACRCYGVDGLIFVVLTAPPGYSWTAIILTYSDTFPSTHADILQRRLRLFLTVFVSLQRQSIKRGRIFLTLLRPGTLSAHSCKTTVGLYTALAIKLTLQNLLRCFLFDLVFIHSRMKGFS